MKKNNPQIVVWIDVDEVLVDFREYFHNYLNSFFSFNIQKGFIPDDWHYSEFFPDRSSFYKAMENMPKSWPLDLRILPGSKEFIDELKKRDAYIVLITHIPSELAPERIKNLVKNDIKFDEIYFTFNRKKSEYAAALMSRFKSKNKTHHLFIDDKAENGYEFLKECPELDYFVTLDDPYNKISLLKMRSEIKAQRFNSESKNNHEMYKKLLKKIDRLIKKTVKKDEQNQ